MIQVLDNSQKEAEGLQCYLLGFPSHRFYTTPDSKFSDYHTHMAYSKFPMWMTPSRNSFKIPNSGAYQ